MSRRFVCFFFFFPSIFRQWNREEGRYRRSCIPRLIGSIESRQKFLACPQKSNIPALGSSSASFAPLHMFARAPARTHAYFRNRGSRFFTPFVHSIFPLPSSFFFLPSSSSKSSSSSSSLRCFRSLFSPFPPDRCVATGIKSWKSIRYITFNEQR